MKLNKLLSKTTRPTKATDKLPLFKQIESFGVELESGACAECINPIVLKYKKTKKVHIDAGHDGSVHVNFKCAKHPTGFIDDELELRAWAKTEDLEILFNFITDLFNTGGFRQNRSCGNHIHLMFVKEDAWRVFKVKSNWYAFIDSYKTLFPDLKYHSRLRNQYCSSAWRVDGWNSKYCMINFGSLNDNDTLEIRVLPYFDSAQEAVNSYLTMLGLVDKMTAPLEESGE